MDWGLEQQQYKTQRICAHIFPDHSKGQSLIPPSFRFLVPLEAESNCVAHLCYKTSWNRCVSSARDMHCRRGARHTCRIDTRNSPTPRRHSQEPHRHPKEAYIHPKEPHTHWQEPGAYDGGSLTRYPTAFMSSAIPVGECHIYKWVEWHMWISHTKWVTHVNQAYQMSDTCEWAISTRVNQAYQIYIQASVWMVY